MDGANDKFSGRPEKVASDNISDEDLLVVVIDTPDEAPKQKENNDLSDHSAVDGAGPLISVKDSGHFHGSCSFSKESESSFRIHCNDQAKGSTDSSTGLPLSELDQLKSKVQVASLFNNGSPEAIKFNPSPKKQQKTSVDAFTPRRTLSRSTFSKPKSRFVEPPHPTALDSIEENTPLIQDRASNSPYRNSSHRATGTPREGAKASGTPKSVFEEDEEEIYKGEDPSVKKEWPKKFGIWLFMEWVALILTMACLICSLTVHSLQDFMIWGLVLWKWCLMVIVIFCGGLVTGWMMSLIVFLIERNFMLRKKVLYFVYGLRKSVQVCIWFGLVLLSWFLMFDRSVERSPTSRKLLSYVSRCLAAALVGSILWLVKTLLVKILASSFHVNTFFDRIQESIFHQYILETLSGPPVMELEQLVGGSRSTGQLSFRTGQGKKGKEEDEQGVIDVTKLHKMNQEKVSAWTMKRLVNMIRGSGLSTISNTIDESVGNGSEQKDNEIHSEWEARAAAYRIFRNVAKPDAKYIDEEDLLRFLSKDEVDNVFPQFEGAVEMGKIKKSAFRNWMVKAYLERKSLAHSLNDTKTAVNQLHKLASGIVTIIIFIVFLLFMGFATTKVLVFISSQLLLVGFMFGNTCKTVFEAIIFVFVMHPFDVGDRCVIDGVQMVVEEMNLLTTVFLRYDNEKIYYPNAVLAIKPISNFYRSPDMGDTVDFSVDVHTSVESIGALKARVQKYIESKPQHWHPKHSVVVKEIEDLNKLKMALYVSHTMNYQNMGEKVGRRSELIFELKKIFEELGIKYKLLPQEIHLNTINMDNSRLMSEGSMV